MWNTQATLWICSKVTILRHKIIDGNKYCFRGESMDFAKLPVGFSMALAQNTPALERFGQMTQQQRQFYIDRAHNARSEREMEQIVSSITAQ